MKNLDKKVILIANSTNGASELKKMLIERGLTVNYFHTGSSVPLLIDNGYFYFGAGNIRRNYSANKN